MWRWWSSLPVWGAFVLSRSLTLQDTHSLGAKVCFASVGREPPFFYVFFIKKLHFFFQNLAESIQRGYICKQWSTKNSYLLHFFFSQVRKICSHPATLAPNPLAPSDRWIPSWTPRMTSWTSSSRRSAPCSLTPTFTWEVMRWTSPAGE